MNRGALRFQTSPPASPNTESCVTDFAAFGCIRQSTAATVFKKCVWIVFPFWKVSREEMGLLGYTPSRGGQFGPPAPPPRVGRKPDEPQAQCARGFSRVPIPVQRLRFTVKTGSGTKTRADPREWKRLWRKVEVRSQRCRWTGLVVPHLRGTRLLVLGAIIEGDRRHPTRGLSGGGRAELVSNEKGRPKPPLPVRPIPHRSRSLGQYCS